MDPLSITAGVFSVLSSLATLSLKINDFREDFQEAEGEIRRLTDQVDALTLNLKQIEEAQSRGLIASRLRDDLSKVLQRLNTTIVETELFLKAAYARNFRGACWAFSGKKQCAQLCRRLESYKLTLNITLTLCNLISGQEMHDKGNQILSGIHNIHRLITAPEAGEDYILQLYLSELETVYENSTIGPGRPITEYLYNDQDEDDDVPVRQSYYGPVASEPRRSSVDPIDRKKANRMSKAERRALKASISQPKDASHIVHTWFNYDTGEFVGLPSQWLKLLQGRLDPEDKAA
ncbi:hypothetical protein ABW21_db0203337 [Orbilia brochopaga]|nr:hypothetical protein ABW21_db0203337 [Drechslerella brochopaga]